MNFLTLIPGTVAALRSVQVSMGVWFRVTSRGPRHWLMWTSTQRRELDRRVQIAAKRHGWVQNWYESVVFMSEFYFIL